MGLPRAPLASSILALFTACSDRRPARAPLPRGRRLRRPRTERDGGARPHDVGGALALPRSSGRRTAPRSRARRREAPAARASTADERAACDAARLGASPHVHPTRAGASWRAAPTRRPRALRGAPWRTAAPTTARATRRGPPCGASGYALVRRALCYLFIARGAGLLARGAAVAAGRSHVLSARSPRPSPRSPGELRAALSDEAYASYAPLLHRGRQLLLRSAARGPGGSSDPPAALRPLRPARGGSRSARSPRSARAPRRRRRPARPSRPQRAWVYPRRGDVPSGPPRRGLPLPSRSSSSLVSCAETGELLPLTCTEGRSRCVTQVALGARFGCAALRDTTVWCWGRNDESQLGYPTTDLCTEELPSGQTRTVACHTFPFQVVGLDHAVRVAAGSAFACAQRDDGTVRCWGSNVAGQLGNGLTLPSQSPVGVRGLGGVTALAAGQRHACAISMGRVYCWGANDRGQLGPATGTRTCATADGPIPCEPEPTLVQGLEGVTALPAGAAHTCALATQGPHALLGRRALRPDRRRRGERRARPRCRSPVLAGDMPLEAVRDVAATASLHLRAHRRRRRGAGARRPRRARRRAVEHECPKGARAPAHPQPARAGPRPRRETPTPTVDAPLDARATTRPTTRARDDATAPDDGRSDDRRCPGARRAGAAVDGAPGARARRAAPSPARCSTTAPCAAGATTPTRSSATVGACAIRRGP